MECSQCKKDLPWYMLCPQGTGDLNICADCIAASKKGPVNLKVSLNKQLKKTDAEFQRLVSEARKEQ